MYPVGPTEVSIQMSKWDNFEALARKNQTALGQTDHADNPLAPINEKIEAIRNQELDLIGRFKRNVIDRRAALESLRSMHEAQLEAAKYALKRAVDVEKERVDAVANRYIFQITEEFLRNMQSLGLQNFQSRMETLLQLNASTVGLLEKAQAQDVPPTIRDATIENIQKKYKEFSDRLMEEEIKLSK
jgi:hypothetical protein